MGCIWSTYPRATFLWGSEYVNEIVHVCDNLAEAREHAQAVACILGTEKNDVTPSGHPAGCTPNILTPKGDFP